MIVAAFIAVTFTLAPAKASALESSDNNLEFLNILNSNRPLFVTTAPDFRVLVPPSTEPVREESDPPEPAKPREYIVQSGDNLSKIAEEQKTTWPRLWNKNETIKHPDVIQIGQVILIPAENETLQDRPIPQPAIAPDPGRNVAPVVPRGSISGNTYSPGYCTWYVKNRRPDIPNGLGNANTWYSRAAGMGLPVGSTPRAGAVGTTTRGDLGHVVYVERVNGDGTITISEMNYSGLYSQRSRTASPGEFLYIY